MCRSRTQLWVSRRATQTQRLHPECHFTTSIVSSAKRKQGPGLPFCFFIITIIIMMIIIIIMIIIIVIILWLGRQAAKTRSLFRNCLRTCRSSANLSSNIYIYIYIYIYSIYIYIVYIYIHMFIYTVHVSACLNVWPRAYACVCPRVSVCCNDAVHDLNRMHGLASLARARCTRTVHRASQTVRRPH